MVYTVGIVTIIDVAPRTISGAKEIEMKKVKISKNRKDKRLLIAAMPWVDLNSAKPVMARDIASVIDKAMNSDGFFEITETDGRKAMSCTPKGDISFVSFASFKLPEVKAALIAAGYEVEA